MKRYEVGWRDWRNWRSSWNENGCVGEDTCNEYQPAVFHSKPCSGHQPMEEEKEEDPEKPFFPYVKINGSMLIASRWFYFNCFLYYYFYFLTITDSKSTYIHLAMLLYLLGFAVSLAGLFHHTGSVNKSQHSSCGNWHQWHMMVW